MIRLTHLTVNGFKQLRNINLTFPARCCVLVEGLNEAGKSALFEAIYTALYGRGLVMRGGGRGQMDSLIGTGLREASVELGLVSGDIRLKVERRLYRERANDARLFIENPDGSTEQIRGVTKVSDEILAQLNGLDGEALLASCFVQQKKLSQLEEVGRDKRQAVLLKLLDLDRLTQLKERFAWRAREDLELSKAQGRRRLAEVPRLRAQAESEHQVVGRQLWLVEIHARLDDADRQTAEAERSRGRMREQVALRDQLDVQISRIEALDHANALLERIFDACQTVHRRGEDVQRIEADLAELDCVEQEILPTRQTEANGLATLGRRLASIEQSEGERRALEERRHRLQEIVTQAEILTVPRENLFRAKGALAEAEAKLAEAEANHQRAQQVRALREWITARQEEETRRRSDEIISSFNAKAALARERQQVAKQQVRGARVLLAIGVVVFALGVGSALLLLPLSVVPGGVIGIIGLVLAVLGWSRCREAIAIRGAAESEAAECERQAHDEGIRQQTLVGKDAVDPAAFGAQLSALGLAEPESVEAGESLAKQIEEHLPEGWTVDQLAGVTAKVRAGVHDWELQIARLGEQVQNEENIIAQALADDGLSDVDSVQYAIGDLDGRTTTLSKQIEAAWEAEAQVLSLYALPPNAAAARQEIEKQQSALAQEIKNLRQQLAQRPGWHDKHGRLLQEIKDCQEHIATWHKELDEVAMTAELPADSLNPGKEDQLQKVVHTERAPYDLSQIKVKREQAANAASRAEADAARAEQGCRSSFQNARQLLVELGVETQNDLDRQVVTEVFPEFGTLSASDRERLDKQRVDIMARLLNLGHETQRLEMELHVNGSSLDETACVGEVERLELRKAVCQKALPILGRVRDNILQAILPGTLDYMRAMLPLLTAGRYHDAELDEETYKIRVWDAQAHEYVEKDIYSGATQDQFSLALRLGFALSALPQERGARPAFIFLDEPTAGFDAQRRGALVELLTRGELAERFDQIFLVAPDGAFPENPFPHHIRLIEGRVVEENLSQAIEDQPGEAKQ